MPTQDRDFASFRFSSVRLYEAVGEGFMFQTCYKPPPHVTVGGVVRVRVERVPASVKYDDWHEFYLPAAPARAEQFLKAYKDICDVPLDYASAFDTNTVNVQKEASITTVDGFRLVRRASTPGAVDLQVPVHRLGALGTSCHVPLWAHDQTRELFSAAYRTIVKAPSGHMAERVVLGEARGEPAEPGEERVWW